MTDAILPVGKLSHELLAELLDEGPPLPPEVLVGPRVGEDACALSVASGVLIAATDPITMTGSAVGGHAVVINANDVAVMGARPRYFLASLLFPVGTRASEVRALFADMRASLAELGAALVGGHTEVSAVVSQPLVVGQMLGLCPAGRWLRTAGVRAGDLLIQVGRAPVEAAAVLAAEAAERLRELDPELLERARDALRDPGISVVEPALHAAELGARALHDPTEGGLSAGLHEFADASGVELRVNDDAVLWFEPATAACAALGADPWGTLASGALLAAFPPERVEPALAAFAERSREARVIATARAGTGVFRADGRPLPRYDRDELSRVLS